MRYFTIIFCSFMLGASAYACKLLFPADINQIKVVAVGPPDQAGSVTGVAGITDFSHDNDDCTMDCLCTYDATAKKWDVKVNNPGTVCLFQDQCRQCKPDSDCTIRFRDLENGQVYDATYHTTPKPVDIKMCAQIRGQPVVCKDLDKFPPYYGPGYLGG